MTDSKWIADLGAALADRQELRAALAAAGVRELLRYRRKLVESQAAERNQLLKLLETANIKLASVASDVFAYPAARCSGR